MPRTNLETEMPKTMTFDRNETALIRKLLATELKRVHKSLERAKANGAAGVVRQRTEELVRVTNLYDEAMKPVMVERTNLMSGAKYMEAEDTPLSCSPASETYWSM